MKTSDAVIIIFCKVVLPSTARLASYLKLSLTLGSLMSLCVFLLWDRVWGIGHADSLQFDAVRCNFPRAAAFSDKHNALLCVCDFLHLFLAHQVLLFVCCRFIQSTYSTVCSQMAKYFHLCFLFGFCRSCWKF